MGGPLASRGPREDIRRPLAGTLPSACPLLPLRPRSRGTHSPVLAPPPNTTSRDDNPPIILGGKALDVRIHWPLIPPSHPNSTPRVLNRSSHRLPLRPRPPHSPSPFPPCQSFQSLGFVRPHFLLTQTPSVLPRAPVPSQVACQLGLCNPSSSPSRPLPAPEARHTPTCPQSAQALSRTTLMRWWTRLPRWLSLTSPRPEALGPPQPRARARGQRRPGQSSPGGAGMESVVSCVGTLRLPGLGPERPTPLSPTA